jgi:hypothetical protein
VAGFFEKPEITEKKTEKRKKREKNGKKREKGPQNIKACRIENTLKLVTPRNDFHHFFFFCSQKFVTFRCIF